MSPKTPKLGVLLLVLALAACGGGGGDSEAPTAEAAPPQPSASGDVDTGATASPVGAASADELTADTVAVAPEMNLVSPFVSNAVVPSRNPSDAQRKAAATTTAQSASNACAPIRPFYWELGNRNGSTAAGSVNKAGNRITYNVNSTMAIASASKWIYAAYVAERQRGVLSAQDIKHLTLRSGYVNMGVSTCVGSPTVDGCLAAGSNGAYTASSDGRFYYDDGHMQKHASLLGLGSADNNALRAAVQSQLGSDIALNYARPMPPGGAVTTPAVFSKFLRKLMNGQLKMGALLGKNAVCSNRQTCGSGQAVFAPVPSTESWHYSLGHWVEDDPVVGDGAFSSAGSMGFYPWIDATKTMYGIVARSAEQGQGYASAQCGRLIRKAWATGVAL